VLQACVLQEVQAGALWVMARPSEWAKKSDNMREVFSPWQSWQAMGASALLIERRASNWVRQSLHLYS
jgi:hypothetical protein